MIKFLLTGLGIGAVAAIGKVVYDNRDDLLIMSDEELFHPKEDNAFVFDSAKLGQLLQEFDDATQQISTGRIQI